MRSPLNSLTVTLYAYLRWRVGFNMKMNRLFLKASQVMCTNCCGKRKVAMLAETGYATAEASRGVATN